MVVLNKIYTRTGDKGDTALGDGARTPKDSARVEAYGTVDEVNAALGVARLNAAEEMAAALARIQNDLFDLGADLCIPDMEKDAERPWEVSRMIPGQTTRLETEIDEMNARMQPLRSFILPGGSALSSHLHVARTIARRAERRVVTLMEREAVNPAALTYLNRLSDWLFVAARKANDDGTNDVLWAPGANR